MKKSLILLAVLATAACSSSRGTQVDQSKMDSFKVGTTTKADVESALGQPQSQSKSSDGTTSLIYSYSRSDTHAANFVPVVGAFTGSADHQHQSEIFMFGADGKLKSMVQNGGQTTTNRGG